LSELRDALGGRVGESLETYLGAEIERLWTCTWRPRVSELRDVIGGCDRARVEMLLEAVIE